MKTVSFSLDNGRSEYHISLAIRTNRQHSLSDDLAIAYLLTYFVSFLRVTDFLVFHSRFHLCSFFRK